MRQRGFSLIEVVVSMLILAVGMVAGLAITQAGQTGMEAGRHLSEAVGLAQANMEEMRSLSYDELSGGDLESEEDVNGFKRISTVEPDAPGRHFMTLRVTVEWKDKTGRPHRTQLVTVRSTGVVP